MAGAETVLSRLLVSLEVAVRPAIAEDIPRLEWGGEFWRLRSRFERAFREQQAGRRLLLIADVRGYPVGRLFVQLARGNPLYANGTSRAYLYSFSVLEALRGNGIGTLLLETAERYLADHGYRWATIAAAKDNDGALRLYERRGYRMFREDPGVWSYTDPAGDEHEVEEPSWVLQKRLSANGE